MCSAIGRTPGGSGRCPRRGSEPGSRRPTVRNKSDDGPSHCSAGRDGRAIPVSSAGAGIVLAESVSVVIPTIGRPALFDAVASVVAQTAPGPRDHRGRRHRRTSDAADRRPDPGHPHRARGRRQCRPAAGDRIGRRRDHRPAGRRRRLAAEKDRATIAVVEFSAVDAGPPAAELGAGVFGAGVRPGTASRRSGRSG